MATIIIQKTTLEYVRTILLPALGTLKNCEFRDNGQLNCELIYQKKMVYFFNLELKGTKTTLNFIPHHIIYNNKEQSFFSYKLDAALESETLQSIESLRDALIKQCQKNNLKCIVFSKDESYISIFREVIRITKRLIKIGLLNNNLLQKKSNVVDELSKIKSLDLNSLRNQISNFYNPKNNDYISHSVLNCIRLLVKEVALDKDYYEFFIDLGDKPIKDGYGQLIGQLLQLAEISKKDYVINWKGSFDHKKPDNCPLITISYNSITVPFHLKYEGETVDTENLLKGLNAFIKTITPNGNRKFQMLQIYNDQCNCVWFVTEKQLKQLCTIVHSHRKDFSEHCCEVKKS